MAHIDEKHGKIFLIISKEEIERLGLKKGETVKLIKRKDALIMERSK